MTRKWWIFLGVGILVGAVALTFAVPALAQDATPTPKPQLGLRFFGFGLGMRGGNWANYDAVAEALGLTPEQLFSELHAGKTLQEIATARGVDLQNVYDALKASQVEAQKAAIEQAVTDGKLTREQADWLLKGLELGFMGKGGCFGYRGMGRGWFRAAPKITQPSTNRTIERNRTITLRVRSL